MLLKVGELARRTGLTNRTLRHYDSIGLLSPSARSDAGYRLYSKDDVARLHAIQALRQIGMQLSDIAELLDRPEQCLSTVVRQQITVMDKQIAQATDLRTRLQLLQVKLDSGDDPKMEDWLSTLELMSTYSKYFTPAELRQLVESWKETRSEWSVLIKDLQKSMSRSVDPRSLEIQPLAKRWMELSKKWMGADFDLIAKWDRMYESEPLVRNRGDISSDIVDYIKPAIKLRLSALQHYFSNEELMSLREQTPAWASLEKKILAAIKNQLPPTDAKALNLLKIWNALVDSTVNHDPKLRNKLINAYRENELLRASSVLSAPAHQYIQTVAASNALQNIK